MSTLISSDMVTRTAETGFITRLCLSECLQLQEPDFLCVEPVFTEFEKASNDQLGVPFMLATKMVIQPYLVALNIAYSQRLAVTAKGYLLDVVQAYKALGYPNFTSIHIPYETYGCPMVGSVLTMLFCKGRMAFLPKKHSVYPGQVCENLLYHATAGRQQGSAYAGTADMNGFYNSNRHFLPDISSWAEQGLRVEYKQGLTSEASNLKAAHRNAIFGVKDLAHGQDLLLCTPVSILKVLREDVKLLDLKPVAKHDEPAA